LEIILDLPFSFPINNIISLSGPLRDCCDTAVLFDPTAL